MSLAPYYQSERVTLYCGDALAVLPEISDASIVVADPPYLFGLASTVGKIGWADLMNSAFFYAAWMRELKRLVDRSAGCAWVFNSWRSFPVLAKASSDIQWPIESLLVWNKEWIGAGGSRGLRPMHEIVGLFVGAGFSIANRGLPDVWNHKWMTTLGKTGHKAEKPAAIIKRMISESGDGETVLDPFTGSGTTGVAAIQLGRKFIGIELEERYCEIAAKRIQEAESQHALFESAEGAA